MKVLKFDAGKDIVVPKESKVLSAGLQNNTAVIWILVPEEYEQTKKVEIALIPTGYLSIGESWLFLQTLQYPNGIVLHVFYREVDTQ